MPPEGFAPHFRSSPLTDPWEPILSRIDPGEAVRLGLELRPAHCNGRGFVHGGLIAALADNAMGLSCALVAGALEAPGAPAPAPAEDGAPRRGYLTVGLTVRLTVRLTIGLTIRQLMRGSVGSAAIRGRGTSWSLSTR